MLIEQGLQLHNYTFRRPFASDFTQSFFPLFPVFFRRIINVRMLKGILWQSLDQVKDCNLSVTSTSPHSMPAAYSLCQSLQNGSSVIVFVQHLVPHLFSSNHMISSVTSLLCRRGSPPSTVFALVLSPLSFSTSYSILFWCVAWPLKAQSWQDLCFDPC